MLCAATRMARIGTRRGSIVCGGVGMHVALEARDANDPQTEAINNNSAMAQLSHRTAFGNEGPSTLDVRIADGFSPSYGEIF